jgi:hypothetical protein
MASYSIIIFDLIGNYVYGKVYEVIEKPVYTLYIGSLANYWSPMTFCPHFAAGLAFSIYI